MKSILHYSSSQTKNRNMYERTNGIREIKTKEDNPLFIIEEKAK